MLITNEEIYGELKELRRDVQDGFDKLSTRQSESETEIAAIKECAVGLRRDLDRSSIVDKAVALVSAAVAGITAVIIGKN